MGGWSEWAAEITGEYFFADPLTFLRTVAGDSEETITWVANHLPGDIHSFSSYPYGYVHFPAVISSLELTEEDSEATRNLLQALKDGIEAKWGFTLQQYESWMDANLDDFDLKNMDKSQWHSLFIYLWHEEDFPRLFKIQPYTEGAAAGDWVARQWFSNMYVMFEEDPYSVIQALATQDTQMRQLVIDNFLKRNLESTGAYTRETFAKLLGSIRLPQSATEGEKAILAELIRRTTEEYGVEVPNTGDAIALTLAMLAVSAGGILCLTRKKKIA